jgi:hypothetical protein
MNLRGTNILLKLKAKNNGNVLLVKAIDELLKMIMLKQWITEE